MSPDESYLYGAADGNMNEENNNIIFKMNIELSTQWSKQLSHEFDPTAAFELDSTGTSLYMSMEKDQCVITKMLTSDGSISYTKRLHSTYS